jgi:hypothetical protein
MPLKLYQKGKIIEPLRTIYIHAEPRQKNQLATGVYTPKPFHRDRRRPWSRCFGFFAELKTLKQQNLLENSEPIPFFLIILSFLRINSAKMQYLGEQMPQLVGCRLEAGASN